jgi:hypothetical protein
MSVYFHSGIHDTQAGVGSRPFNDRWVDLPREIHGVPSQVSKNADNGTNISLGVQQRCLLVAQG